MAEKSSATEGSSIFETLFGGFSNGLSIFTNNPFRRKNEIASLTAEDASALNDGEFSSKRSVNEGASGEVVVGTGKKLKKSAIEELLEKAENVLEEKEENLTRDGDVQATVQITEYSETTLKIKKAKRAEEEVVVSEKKRRRTEPEGDITDEKDVKNGSSDSRKRNAEEEAQLDDTTSAELTTKKVKKKKSASSRAAESEQHVLRQSTRNLKKRQNEDPLQGSVQKGRKLEKTAARNEESAEGLKLTGKRHQELEGGEKRNKKTKRLAGVQPETLVPGKDSTEELVTGVSPGVETRLGSKRKKDSELEDSYERKRRETVDEKETSRVDGNGEQGGGAVTQLVDRLRGKRKVTAEGDEEDGLKGAKKKRTTREGKIDNEERLKRTVFVGNLPVSVKTKQLSREFSQYGAVESSRLRSVPLVDSKLPRKAAVITGQLNESRTSVNGYVVFEKEESARAALAHNMTQFNGKHLRVDMATAPRKDENNGESGIEYDQARSIFVGNLPFDVEDEEIYSLFKGQRPDLEVEAVRVVRDPQTSIGKGFAFVCFKKKVGATSALDNAAYTRLRNRQLRIIRFGVQKKSIRGNFPARTNTKDNGPRPRPGAEERLSKRRVLSYEGTRSSKVDGRPGKGTGPPQTSHMGKSGRGGGPSKSGKAGKRNAPTKRPAVAARKLASQGKSGTVGKGGGKRKREEKGKKLDSKGKRIKSFKK